MAWTAASSTTQISLMAVSLEHTFRKNSELFGTSLMVLARKRKKGCFNDAYDDETTFFFCFEIMNTLCTADYDTLSFCGAPDILHLDSVKLTSVNL